jgi:ubiquinone/menaquinone biosynthesis C-methylase UbiE
MGIHKAKTMEEVYKLKASHRDINELSGRSESAKTQFIAENIASKLQLKSNSILIDVGCGDGRLLECALQSGVDPFRGRIIGLLPNIEEVLRVTDHLATRVDSRSRFISIVKGDASSTSLPENYADIVVCNGVLHGSGMKVDYVKSALNEFHRILAPASKPGETLENKVGKGILYIGEMPDSNETVLRPYGDSIVKWLYWVIRNQGLSEFVHRLKQVFRALTGNEPLIIVPKFHFYASPKVFSALLEESGFSNIHYWKFIELDRSGSERASETRWNYLAIKE